MRNYLGYRQDVGMTICDAIVKKYPTWTSYDLNSSEEDYLSRFFDTFPSNNSDELVYRPSKEFAYLWEGRKGGGREHLGSIRFYGKSEKTLQHRFALKFKDIRRCFVTRALNTLSSFVKCKSKVEGLDRNNEATKLNAIINVLSDGLDRTKRDFLILKPLFQSFALPREKKSMENNSVASNLTKVPLVEFQEVNGKRFDELLKPTDVARILLVMENFVVKVSALVVCCS